jgi:hypothetical protein
MPGHQRLDFYCTAVGSQFQLTGFTTGHAFALHWQSLHATASTNAYCAEYKHMVQLRSHSSQADVSTVCSLAFGLALAARAHHLKNKLCSLQKIIQATSKLQPVPRLYGECCQQQIQPHTFPVHAPWHTSGTTTSSTSMI